MKNQAEYNDQIINIIKQRPINKYDINVFELQLNIANDMSDFSIDNLRLAVEDAGYPVIRGVTEATAQGVLYIILS